MPDLNQAWNGEWNTTALVVLVTSTLSIYNALELLTLVPLTFKRWQGLYFWSLLISSFAVLPYSIGLLIRYLALSPLLLFDVMNNLGWITLVTGQSVVLYSRLGVILPNHGIMRFILWMIIIDSVVFYISTTVVHYGTYTGQSVFTRAMFYLEKIQMTGFCIQEFIISGLYVREVIRYSKFIAQGSARRTMWELFTINVIIIVLDIGLLVMEYLDLTVFEQSFKGVTYSIKLKMESAILGKLVMMAKAGSQIAWLDNLGQSGPPSDGSSKQRAFSEVETIDYFHPSTPRRGS